MTPTASSTYDDVIYLDYNATTPLDPRVLEAMAPYNLSLFGNSASRHLPGIAAADGTENARELVAALVGAQRQDIVFTSGATESNNLALLGVAAASGEYRRHLITVATEHKAVLDVLAALGSRGYEITVLVPDRSGWLSPDKLAAAIRSDTLMVSVMGANNEIGTLAPVKNIGRLCRSEGVLFHCDGAQLVGKLPVDVDESNIDLLSISAHKMYGPKGVGALYVRRLTPISPIFYGGGHERGLRSGTLNVPAIVGFGMAAQLASSEMQADMAHAEELRRQLVLELQRAFSDLEINGHQTARLPGTLNVRLPRIDGESLQLATPRLAIASGSACTSAAPEPSHVLRAIGRTWDEAQECLRLSYGRFTTPTEIESAVKLLYEAAQRLGRTNRKEADR